MANNLMLKTIGKNVVANNRKTPIKSAVPPKKADTFYSLVGAAIDGTGLPDDQVRTLRALIGQGGHCVRQLSSDADVRQTIAAHTKAIFGQALATDFRGRAIVKIEAYDDSGLSDPAAPQLRIKVIADRVTKMLTGLKMEAYGAFPIRQVRDGLAPNHDAILMGCIALGFVPENADSAELQARLRRCRAVAARSVPNIRVTVVSTDQMDEAIDTLFRLPTRALRFQADGAGVVKRLADELSTAEALRMAEIVAEVPVQHLTFATGQVARACAGRIKTAAAAHQRGRVASGHILPVPFDSWPTWSGVHRHMKSDALNVRTDLGMPRAPTVPKPKKVAARNKEQAKKRAALRAGMNKLPKNDKAAK